MRRLCTPHVSLPRWGARLLSFAVLALSIFLVGGCAGGGTSGTGVVRVLGVASYDDGTPLRDTEVVIEEGGETTRTDAHGMFEIELPTSREITLTLRGEEVDDTAAVELPPEALLIEEVEIEITVARDSHRITAVRARVQGSDIVSPAPTRAPVRTPRPHLTPTQEPLVIPSRIESARLERGPDNDPVTPAPLEATPQVEGGGFLLPTSTGTLAPTVIPVTPTHRLPPTGAPLPLLPSALCNDGPCGGIKKPSGATTPPGGRPEGR